MRAKNRTSTVDTSTLILWLSEQDTLIIYGSDCTIDCLGFTGCGHSGATGASDVVEGSITTERSKVM